MGFAEHFLHTHIDTCFSYLPTLCNHCPDEVWPIQKKKKIQCRMVGSMKNHNLFSAQQNPFSSCSLISHSLCSLQKPWQWQIVPFYHSSTFAFGRSAINRKVFVLALFGSQARPMVDTPAFPCFPVVLPRESSHTNKYTALFGLSLKSQFLPLNVYTFQSWVTGLASWEPSAGGFVLLSGRFRDVCLMALVNKLISMLFLVFSWTSAKIKTQLAFILVLMGTFS